MNKSAKARFAVFSIIHLLLLVSAIAYIKEYAELLYNRMAKQVSGYYVDGSDMTEIVNGGISVFNSALGFFVLVSYIVAMIVISAILVVLFRFIAIRKNSCVTDFEVKLTFRVIAFGLSAALVTGIIYFKGQFFIPMAIMLLIPFTFEMAVYWSALKSKNNILDEADNTVTLYSNLERSIKMFVSKNLGVNEKGHLTAGGVDTVELAKNYGTPLYVMDEDLIRENCRSFKASIDKYYGGKGLVCYASKVFSCKAVCKIVMEEGIGLDVVSDGELYTAASVGFPMEKVCFHGNNKTDGELEMAIDHKVGRIIVDNIFELERLNKLAEKKDVTANIMFRIKPGIDAHTHDFIRTGQIDSKFGFALETGEAFEAVKKAVSLEHINLVGLHCHIGSQIFEIDPFVLAAEVMVNFIAKIKNELNCEVKELNLGGGFGIKYTEDENPVPYENYMEKVSVRVKEICAEQGLEQPFILIEPGRSIAGPAGITLYTVGGVKNIPNIRTYVSIDGGMNDNPRYALYKSKYEAVVANKADKPRDTKITLAGKCCESGDLIGEEMSVQQVEAGDIIAVLATGAYNYSMSSNYNRIAKPAVVMLKGGESRVVVKRETLEDIVRNDV